MTTTLDSWPSRGFRAARRHTACSDARTDNNFYHDSCRHVDVRIIPGLLGQSRPCLPVRCVPFCNTSSVNNDFNERHTYSS